MSHLRSYGALAVATVLLAVAQLLLMPLSASAYSGPTSPAVPQEIAVPPDAVLVFVSRARGLQNYTCQNGQWAFRAPRAELFDPESNQRTGIHYGGINKGLTPGPWWESVSDGSSIRGGNAKIEPNPTPGNIPQLRLDVLEHGGAGVFSPIRYIQRLNTVGGVGPTGACSGSQERWVVYTADYYFYR